VLPLDLRPSWRFALLIAGLHALAAACLAVAIPGLMGAVLAALLAALGGAAAWDRALLRGRRSPRRLRVSSDLSLQVELADGTSCPVAAGARTVNRFLVALPLEGRLRRSILVTADMLDPERFRLLRLWALWGRLPGVAPAQLRG
jgi:membrane-bound toxin of toxin-antitoxin system